MQCCKSFVSRRGNFESVTAITMPFLFRLILHGNCTQCCHHKIKGSVSQPPRQEKFFVPLPAPNFSVPWQATKWEVDSNDSGGWQTSWGGGEAFNLRKEFCISIFSNNWALSGAKCRKHYSRFSDIPNSCTIFFPVCLVLFKDRQPKSSLNQSCFELPRLLFYWFFGKTACNQT